jgi:hypothetical protein
MTYGRELMRAQSPWDCDYLGEIWGSVYLSQLFENLLLRSSFWDWSYIDLNCMLSYKGQLIINFHKSVLTLVIQTSRFSPYLQGKEVLRRDRVSPEDR